MGQKKIPFQYVKKLTNGELRMMLAQHQMSLSPKLYEGHYDDALKFVKNYNKNRKDLILSAQCAGIVGFEWEK